MVITSPEDGDDDAATDSQEHAEIWDGDEDARFFAAEALTSLLGHVDLRQPEWKQRRVLDFGCGTGLLTEQLAPLVREVVAVDISAAMLSVLRSKNLGNVQVICANLDDDSAEAVASWLADFDLIVASCVCDLLPRYDRTLASLVQALRPGGVFVQWDWLAVDDAEDDGLTLERVAAALAQSGLSRVTVGQAFAVVYESDSEPVLMGMGRRD